MGLHLTSGGKHNSLLSVWCYLQTRTIFCLKKKTLFICLRIKHTLSFKNNWEEEVLYLWGDDLYGSHEAVCDDRHPKKHVDQAAEVEHCSSCLLTHPWVLREPHGQQNAWSTYYLISAGTLRRHTAGNTAAAAVPLGWQRDSEGGRHIQSTKEQKMQK